MTTLSQLKKIARSDFLPTLEKKGFSLISTFTLTREADEKILHVISPIISYGTNLKVYITCYTPEMDEDDLPQYRFPKGLPTMVGGELDPDQDPSPISGHLWKVGNETDAKRSFDEVLKWIRLRAFPFFQKIQNREALINNVHRQLRAQYAEEIEKIRSWSASRNKP